jgi:rhodanese-related sulfurtransferase
MSEHVYAGDKTPQETWGLLAVQPEALLIDVRSSAEWSFVGVPDLSGVSKEVVLAAWQEFPDMSVNPAFVNQVQNVASDLSTPLFFLCRSGQRSQAAAAALAAAGYNACYNVIEGFEGDKDDAGHRGTLGGWKFHSLPWKQR